MGFTNLDPTTDVFLVQDAVNCSFKNVGFRGPLTQADLTTEGDFTRGAAFASTTSLVCEQIVFDGCEFSGTVYGVDTDQQVKGVTFTNGKFDTVYHGVQLGTNTVVNGGATGVRITHNVFDNIYADGIVFGNVELNATGYNIFYDVGNHFGGTTTPYTAVIDIQSNNNLSIGDMFQRADAYAGSSTPGTAYPRITLNLTQSIATTNGVETQQGTYTRQSGVSYTLADNSSGVITTIDSAEIAAFSVNYTLIRTTGCRTGTMLVASPTADSTGDIDYSDDFVENSTTGVTLTFTESADIISFRFATTATGNTAQISYSITYLA
jgi:hypothetical protein